MSPTEVLIKIAGRLEGAEYEALTVTERQIADILIAAGYLKKKRVV